MSNPLSSNAVIYAILSLNSEIALQKDYLADNNNSDNNSDNTIEDRDNEAGILDDLEQAFMEFIDLYKSYTQKNKMLPNIEDLLNNDL